MAESMVREGDDVFESSVNSDTLGAYFERIRDIPKLDAEQEVELAKNIEAGLYAEEVLDEIQGGLRQVDQNEIDELQRIAEIGRLSKQHFIESNLKLVVHFAKNPKFKNKGVSFLDLISAGNIGLIRAVEKFDYTQGTKFSTYAADWIQRYIRRAFSEVNDNLSISLPDEKYNILRKVSQLVGTYIKEHGYRPSTEQLHEFDESIPIEQLEWANDILSTFSTISLHEVLYHEEDGDGDRMSKVPDHEEGYIRVEDELLLSEILGNPNVLTDQESAILIKYFGITNNTPMSIKDIAISFRLPESTVVNCIDKSLAKIKHPITGIVDLDAWRDEALCRARGNIDDFFPRPGQYMAANRAKDLCRVCPVKYDCLQYALDHSLKPGIWGGTSRLDREKMVKS